LSILSSVVFLAIGAIFTFLFHLFFHFPLGLGHPQGTHYASMKRPTTAAAVAWLFFSQLVFATTQSLVSRVDSKTPPAVIKGNGQWKDWSSDLSG
jgi:hypothetical protein